MIKKIQLRGISRVPSDRAVEDGGCAESLNVQIEGTETAPSPIPRNVTSEKTGSSSAYVQYVHKLPSGKEVFIGQGSDMQTAYTLVAYCEGTAVSVTGAPRISTTSDIAFASVGNVLVEYVNSPGGAQTVHYYIYKDGGYTYLGNNLPKPAIEFATRKISGITYLNCDIAGRSTSSETVASLKDMGGNTGALTDAQKLALWENAKKESNINHTELLDTISNIWAKVALYADELREQGYFVAPFFIRYALKLYDGSYIYTSEPILCGAGSSLDWVHVYLPINIIEQSSGVDMAYWINGRGLDDAGHTYDDGTGYSGYRLKVGFSNPYKILLKGAFSPGDWGDFIQSIDIFASTPIYAPNMNEAFAQLVSDGNQWLVYFNGMTPGTRRHTIEDEVLSKGQFYKIMSISTSDSAALASLTGGGMTIQNSQDVSGDLLPTRVTMPDSYRDGNIYMPINGTIKYNDRLALLGAKEMLAHGGTFLSGQVLSSQPSGARAVPRYAFRYKLSSDIDGSVHYVVGNYYDGTNKIYAAVEGSGEHKLIHGKETTTDPSGYYYRGEAYAWLSYPDSRCTEVEVYRYALSGAFEGGKRVPMKAHPYLECAYAFLGFGMSLEDLMDDSSYASISSDSSLSSESAEIASPDKLFISAFQNPFKIDAEGIISFGAEVLGAAATSVPLSEGQYGQFPLYVFTADGIRTLALNNEGGISAKVAQPGLARHVAIKGSVLGIEQAVIFTTEQGVMLLRGSEVQCISEVMNGRHYTIDSALDSHLSAWDGKAVLQDLNNGNPFMTFMKTAKPSYDYNGARLIFTSDGYFYHYVYCLRSKTWHKMSLPHRSWILPINSFPECLMGNEESLYDYSTVLDDAALMSNSSNLRSCLIATRPLDFGEPNVRKALKDIRIRGAFNGGDVKYVLEGSMDCINWRILTTLHGGSFKWFRVVVLGTLAPTERISWIDVDYEPRMTNKLR